MTCYLVCLILVGVVGIAEVQGCLSGWKSHGGKCYRYMSAKKNIQDHRTDCLKLGGYLAEPTSASENAFIRSLISAQSFLGFNDQKTEGSFIGYASGASPSGYTNWNGGEPNNWGSGEDCSEMYINAAGVWNDIKCGAHRAAVCEYVDCKSGWKLFGGKCYQASNSKKTHAQATSACNQLGGYLAEPQSKAENDFIRTLIKAQSFIGLNDKKKEGTFVMGRAGNSPHYKNWNGGEPNDARYDEDCVEMYIDSKGVWNDIDCDAVRSYVCEYQACRTGWKPYGGKCYRVVSKPQNQADAQKACHESGGYLAQPRSAGENKFVRSLITGTSYIGYNDKAKEGSFVGEGTEKALSYSKWRSHEPNDWYGEDCVEMKDDKEGQWNDIGCENTKPAVCEYGSCKAGWTYYLGNCYRYESFKRDNAAAQAACKSEGGYLAEPRTEQENDFIRTLIAAQSFLGYSDKTTENKFLADESGLAVTYSNWNNGEPNNAGPTNNEDCVEMYIDTDGVWNDIRCGSSRAFVCESGGRL